MPERDPALLPGPTAGEWLGRARLALALSGGILVVVLALLGFGVRLPLPVVALAGLAAVAGFGLWVRASGAAIRRMREEREHGYATAADVPGLALRDARTGRLERAAHDPPAAPADVPLIRRMLRAPSRWGAEDDATGK